MIFHNCINCDELTLIPLDDKLRMQKIVCEKCKTTQYLKHSRINPTTYPEDMVIVDEKKHQITLKEKLGK